MRPTVFSASLLRQFLRKNRIATLPQLKQLLGTEADITVFRKLRELSYRTSYSHRGSFYTLDEIATFDERGLWSFNSVWFSRHGTLVATAENCVNQASAGYFASELQKFFRCRLRNRCCAWSNRTGSVVRPFLASICTVPITLARGSSSFGRGKDC